MNFYTAVVRIRVNMSIEQQAYPSNPTLWAIAANRRREIITTLLDRDTEITEHELALRLAGTEPAAPVSDETKAEVHDIRTALTHVHLPKLEAAALIDRDPHAETLKTSSHPALDDPRFRRLLTIEAEGVDTALAGLSHDHRRIVLTLLREATVPLTRTDLAREVLGREPEFADRDSPSVDEVKISLHHSHLPRLVEPEFIEYDPETGQATYLGHHAVERVIETVTEPDEQVAAKLDGFFGGLQDTYQRASREASEPLAWPHFWRAPYHG